MADAVQIKLACGTSSTLLATDDTDDFKEGRKHLRKQRMIDNRNIKVTQITHTKLIVTRWCIH